MPEQQKNYTIDQEKGRVLVHESFVLPAPTVPRETVEHLTEEAKSLSETPTVIYPLFHALRAETLTRNRTWYTKNALAGNRGAKTGIYSALRPYRIPFIEGHRSGGWDGQSDVYGRVVNAFMVDNALEGKSAAAMIVGVAHPHAVAQILNGNWCTVSMGSSTEEAYCGICKANLLEKPCDHNRWDDKEFYVIIDKKGFKFREISNVVMPSDVGAQLVAPDVDVKAYKLFAADTKKESVYDLSDPNRTNLLEHPLSENYSSAMQMHESTQWLLDEFAPARKKFYSIAPPAVVGEKEPTMPESLTTVIERANELPDEDFGLVYTDEASLKRVRRFPFGLATDDASKEALRTMIANAVDLEPEQREALLARLDAAEAVAPIMVAINSENYHCLLDMATTLRAEYALLQCAPALETAEAVVEEPAPNADATEETAEAEVPAQHEDAEEETPADTEVLAQELEDGTAAADAPTAEAELSRLYAEVIARQKFALREHVTHGKTVDEFITRYESLPLEALRVMHDELRPTYDRPIVDQEHIETVEDPVAGVATEVAPVIETPAPVAESEAEESEDTNSIARRSAYYSTPRKPKMSALGKK